MNRRSPGRRGAIVLPSLAAGFGLALSLPPWGWWPLAFMGAALLYWRLGSLRMRTRILAGWLTGVACYGTGLFWARSFNWYGAAALVMAEALAIAVAAGLTPPGPGRLPAFVGANTLLEALRMTWPFGGLPIGGVFLGQAQGPLLAAARLGGPLLLTALVWGGGGALGALAELAAGRWRVGQRPASPARRSLLPGVLALAMVVLAGLGGAIAPDGGPPVRRLAVAAVQGGGRRGTSEAEVRPSTVFGAELAATTRLLGNSAGTGPQLVLWPEDVIAITGPLTGTPDAADMAWLAHRLSATVIAGVTSVVSPTAFRNEAVAWGPDGRVVGAYEKVHRVPFGEYVPYRSFFSHLANLSAVPLNAVPGHGSGFMRTPAGPLGLLVSYEVFFANRSRPSVSRGAELLVVPTNTSSFGTGQVPAQEVAADEVQAVETGRDLVQAAPTGYSTVVNNTGDLERRSALGRRQVITATVALRTGRTLYDLAGDGPALGLAALLWVVGWAADLRRRRQRGASDGHGEPVVVHPDRAYTAAMVHDPLLKGRS